MTIIREFNPDTDWFHVKRTAAPVMCVDTCGIVACDPVTNEIYGAIIFDSFSRNSCQSHICIANPVRALRAGLLEAAAHYIFNERDRGVIFGLTPDNNTEAKRFDKHIGWYEVARLEDGYDKGVDYIVYQMKKDECRWLKPRCVKQPKSTLKEVSNGR